MSSPTEIEKKNLEAHVEICAVRYANLDSKLSNLEQRMDKFEVYLVSIQEKLDDRLEGRGNAAMGYVVGALFVAVAAILGFVANGMLV